MQKVAAYLLERRDDMEWPEARARQAADAKAMVEKWLLAKGASTIGSTGTYGPEDGSAGSFKIREAADGQRSWWMVELQEDTAEGRRFSTGLSITAAEDKVSVYVTLETGSTTTHVVPVSSDPRCPRVVRDLLQLPGRWCHGDSLLGQLKLVRGFEEGEGLVRDIDYTRRSVPIVAITRYEGDLALPDLDSKLAYDLAGLANVYVMDEDAAWALTDILGRDWSCFHGAVRLYWPHFALNQDRFSHPLWTFERLRSRGENLRETRDRFRRQLREIVFRASALSVVRPHEIDEIREADSRRAVSELRRKATSSAEYEEIANTYAAENDSLRSELAAARSQIDTLQEQVGRLEGDKRALQAHLASKGQPVQTDEEISPGGDESDPASAEPTSGETRFYKKIGARETHDVLKRVQDCGCNKWQGAQKADKAKKGISKLENGRKDWKNVQHCASCTGGGMWKVRW